RKRSCRQQLGSRLVNVVYLPVIIVVEVLQALGQLAGLLERRLPLCLFKLIGVLVTGFELLEVRLILILFLLFAQLLNAPFVGEPGLLRIALLQGGSGLVVEVIDMQHYQHMLDIAQPAFGSLGFQLTLLGGPDDQRMQVFELQARLLGTRFAENLFGWILDANLLSLHRRVAKLIDTRGQGGIRSIQRLQALAQVQFQACQQQFQRRRHQLPREAARQRGATADSVGKVRAHTGLFQLVLFDELAEIADDYQYEQACDDQSCNQSR